MDNETANSPEERRSTGLRAIPGVIVGSAFQALWCALIFMIFAEIAFAISTDIFMEMIPSMPPGVESGPVEEGESLDQAPTRGDLKALYKEYKYWFYYSLSFLGLAVINVSGAFKKKPTALLPEPLRKVGVKLWQNWFKILVMNAFGCMIAAIVFVILQNVSFIRILIDIILALLQPVFYRTASLFMNAEAIATAAGFVEWFHDSEVKFAFWAFYLTAVLDDLGLPNIKTLVKQLYRRLKRPSNQKTNDVVS